LSGHCVGGRVEPAGNLAGSQTGRASLNEQAENLQPPLLREGGQAFDGCGRFYISWIPELLYKVNSKPRASAC